METTLSDEKRDKMLERVRALIDKAENTDFVEEAEAFMNKAQELLTQYALDEAMLDLVDKNRADRDKVVTVVVRVGDPHAKARVSLLSSVARSNNVKIVLGGYTKSQTFDHYKDKYDDVIFADGPGGKKRTKNGALAYLTGFSRDVDATMLLFTSLMIQSTREFAHVEVPAYENKYTYYRHFILAYATTIGSRLMLAKRDAVKVAEAKAQETDTTILPVLADRQAQVDNEYERRWAGRLGKGRAQNYDYGRGGAAGAAAGKRADVGNVRVGAGGRRALGA